MRTLNQTTLSPPLQRFLPLGARAKNERYDPQIKVICIKYCTFHNIYNTNFSIVIARLFKFYPGFFLLKTI